MGGVAGGAAGGEAAGTTPPLELVDVPAPRPVVRSELVHEGLIWDLVRDTVDLGESVVQREYVKHPGAVAVIALDDEDRVLLVRQYRHAVRAELWEPPAGLLDVEGEDRLEVAKRELAEEADLVAADWWTLVEYYSSPGGNDEELTVFLARGLTPVPEGERYTRVDEERELVVGWFPLEEAVGAVMAGGIRNPSAVVGVLAAAFASARADGPFGAGYRPPGLPSSATS